MKPVSYNGYTVTPSIYQDSNMPGDWFPLVVVSSGDLTTPRNVALPPTRGLDENFANEQAMKVAVQRIQHKNL